MPCLAEAQRPAAELQVALQGSILPAREIDQAHYVPWDALARSMNMEYYFSDVTRSFSLFNDRPGEELALEMTPGSDQISLNGEIRRLSHVPVLEGRTLWVPVRSLVSLLGIPAASVTVFRPGEPPPSPGAEASGQPADERSPPAPVLQPPPTVEQQQAAQEPEVDELAEDELQSEAPPAEAASNPAAAVATEPVHGRPVGRQPAPDLPPLHRLSVAEKSRLLGLTVALFARTPGPAAQDDAPSAAGAAGRLQDLLENSGLRVKSLPSGPDWPGPDQINRLRPGLTIYLDVTPRLDRFWILHPGAVPVSGSSPAGLFGPNHDEVELSRDLASRLREVMARFTGISGRTDGEPNLLVLKKIMTAGNVIDFPGGAGAAGVKGEQALARAIHDGVVGALLARVTRYGDQPGPEDPVVEVTSTPLGDLNLPQVGPASPRGYGASPEGGVLELPGNASSDSPFALPGEDEMPPGFFATEPPIQDPYGGRDPREAGDNTGPGGFELPLNPDDPYGPGSYPPAYDEP